MPNPPSIGQELLNVPMGHMIRQMAFAIADAQLELDKSSMMVAEMMSGQRVLRDQSGFPIGLDGAPLAPVTDSNGQVVRDSEGDPVYDIDKGPVVTDSRVYFGYTYEPVVNAAGQQQTWPDGKVKMQRKPRLVSMMELGFTPNFYQFVDTIIEVKIAIKIVQESESKWGYSASSSTTSDGNYTTASLSTRGRFGSDNFSANYSYETGKRTTTVASSVDASYANKYSYTAEGASLLRTKLVPIPPPAILEERIRQVMQEERDYLSLAAQGVHGVVGEEAARALTAGTNTIDVGAETVAVFDARNATGVATLSLTNLPATETSFLVRTGKYGVTVTVPATWTATPASISVNSTTTLVITK